MQKTLLVLQFFFATFISGQKTEFGTVTDIEGNIYKTVTIGKYEWMAENLKTTKYNDGSEIPNVTSKSEWITLDSGAYCWYDNDSKNRETYGALYNWYAVNTGKLCPKGWRVPSDDEWKYLEKYVDSLYVTSVSELQRTIAGKYLKSKTGWLLDGNGEDNFGFSALPGGERPDKIMGFRLQGRNGFWWSSTESGEVEAWFRSIIYALDDVSSNTHNKKFGFSVRCVKEKINNVNK